MRLMDSVKCEKAVHSLEIKMKNETGRNEGIIPLSDFLISIMTFNLEQAHPDILQI